MTDNKTADKTKIKVLLAEDDLDFVYLVRKMINRDARLEFLSYATNKQDCVTLARELKPDIVLIDVSLSECQFNMDGIEAARDIRLTTDAKIILLTSFEQSEIIINASKKSFASGYVFKSGCNALADIIYDTAVSPSTPQKQFIKALILQDLTTAEREVFNMLIEGGWKVKSASKTIANQKTSIYRKLGLKNIGELMCIFGNY